MALAGALALAACGVSTDDRPHEISQSNVPEGILDEDAPGSDADAGSGEPGEAVIVWFLQDDENGEVTLTPRERTVPRPPRPATILDTLLLDGPTEREREADITTAIPRSARQASTPNLEGGVLVIDLSRGFFDVSGDDLRNAYAQIVCTATDIRGVRAAEFETDGAPAEAFDGDGQSSNRPLTCDDYSQLLPDEG